MARNRSHSDSSDDTDDSLSREISNLDIDDELPDDVEIPPEQASIRDFQKVSVYSRTS